MEALGFFVTQCTRLWTVHLGGRVKLFIFNWRSDAPAIRVIVGPKEKIAREVK